MSHIVCLCGLSTAGNARMSMRYTHVKVQTRGPYCGLLYQRQRHFFVEWVRMVRPFNFVLPQMCAKPPENPTPKWLASGQNSPALCRGEANYQKGGAVFSGLRLRIIRYQNQRSMYCKLNQDHFSPVISFFSPPVIIQINISQQL